ncbi:MAG: hypothetical protein LBP87_02680 [Planctomycetaceae bacterium]|nr:hypothetical protein [Planctomycetaceae bacterium]
MSNNQNVNNLKQRRHFIEMPTLFLFTDGNGNNINHCDLYGEMLGKLDPARGQI